MARASRTADERPENSPREVDEENLKPKRHGGGHVVTVPPLLQRWGHPGQQHGLRMPPCILSIPTLIRRSRVASCFAEVAQQIHSFRASGVMSRHRLWALAFDSMAFRKSAGSG